MSRKKQKSQAKSGKTKQKSKRAADRFQFWWVIAIATFLVVGGFWIMGRNQPAVTASLPTEISVNEAYQKYEAGAFVLDVRTPEEWNEFHVPNTTHIPLDQLASRVNEIPRDQEILVVCRSGNRSQQGRDILLQAGFEQVTSMRGGLNEWRSTGYPITTGP